MVWWCFSFFNSPVFQLNFCSAHLPTQQWEPLHTDWFRQRPHHSSLANIILCRQIPCTRWDCTCFCLFSLFISRGFNNFQFIVWLLYIGAYNSYTWSVKVKPSDHLLSHHYCYPLVFILGGWQHKKKGEKKSWFDVCLNSSFTILSIKLLFWCPTYNLWQWRLQTKFCPVVATMSLC